MRHIGEVLKMGRKVYEKKCPYCDKLFTTDVYQRKYCSDDCGKAMRVFLTVNPRVKEKTISPLQKISVEARKHGMSYGQYVAHMKI